MEQLKVYITLEVPDDFFGDYRNNIELIHDGVDHLADLVDGEIRDVEIK